MGMQSCIALPYLLYEKHKDELHKNFTAQKEFVGFFVLN